MITRIAIENFKGIADRVEIPIRPLTLLFGPNSAGKSTIMHAFHYAREVFERHNLDADRTIAGGDFIDLGGFQSFVHGHDLNREVSIAIELDLSGIGHFLTDLPEEDLLLSPVWENRVRTGSAEVTVAWDPLRARPFVKRYEVSLNGETVGAITAEKSTVALTSFNLHHPVFASTAAGQESSEGPYEAVETLVERALSDVTQGHGFLTLLEQDDALPPRDKSLEVYFSEESDSLPGCNSSSENYPEQKEFLDTLNRVFVEMAEQVRGWLGQFCYIGPIREKPPRDYAPPRLKDPSRWATGLGAWDELHSAWQEHLSEVNLWLVKDFLLDTGYTVLLKDLLLVDPEGPLYASLVSGRAFDEIEDIAQALDGLEHHKQLVLLDRTGLQLAIQDVGEGIAQVLPVVVAALRPNGGIVQVEQPELHLHPRQQAALGDLLIRGALSATLPPLPSGLSHLPKIILAETHSEHLILRVLRRIRETSKGEEPPSGAVTTSDVAVYYVDKQEGRPTEVFNIGISDNGEFLQPWPDDFFEIDFQERFA